MQESALKNTIEQMLMVGVSGWNSCMGLVRGLQAADPSQSRIFQARSVTRRTENMLKNKRKKKSYPRLPHDKRDF